MGQTKRAPYRIFNGTDWDTINFESDGDNHGLFRQALINGNFDIWQRGESFVNCNGYTADRWLVYRYGGVNNSNCSVQSVGDLLGTKYGIKVGRTIGDTQQNGIVLQQVLETYDSVKLRGRKLTVSAYVKKSATANGTFKFVVDLGMGVDQSAYNGFYNNIKKVSNTLKVSDKWQKFSFTFNVESDRTQIAIALLYEPNGTSIANEEFSAAQMQLNVGETELPFSPNSQGDELIKCQRYYRPHLYKATATSNQWLATLTPLNPPMRIKPSIFNYGADSINTKDHQAWDLTVLTSSPEIYWEASAGSGNYIDLKAANTPFNTGHIYQMGLLLDAEL